MPHGNLRPADEKKIKDNYMFLLEQLDAKFLVDELFSKGVLDKNDKAEINAINSPRGRTEKLLSMILDSGPGESYGIFIESLKTNNAYPHVAEQLEGKEPVPESSTSVPERASQAVGTKYDIFISYSWKQGTLVERLFQYLKANRPTYEIWYDKKDASGRLLKAMGDGIDKSSVILVCVSEEYQKSENCQSEADYSFKLKKKIIPVMVQKKYTPDSWLGFLTGSRLYFDLDSDFDGVIQKLCREIDSNLGSQEQQQEGVGNPEASTENADS